EDAVQEAEVVARALDQLVVVKADGDELLDVLLGDLRDRLLTEEWRDVDPQVALIADGRRCLPALRRQVANQPLPRFLDGHPLVTRGAGACGYELAQPGLGHLAGQAVSTPGCRDRTELARESAVPHSPLAVPRVALLEDAAGAVLALAAADCFVLK